MSDAASAQLRLGPLADAEMLTGPLPRRRALLERVAASGLDHVFMADHVSFHTGFGPSGRASGFSVALLAALARNVLADDDARGRGGGAARL